MTIYLQLESGLGHPMTEAMGYLLLEDIIAPTVPAAPTVGTITAGNGSITVPFTANFSGGSPITGFTVTASPGGATVSGPSSPLTVAGLTNGTAYTATVHATNAVGNSVESAISNSVTPSAGTNLTMYSNGVIDLVDFPTATYDLSFGVVQNSAYTVNPKPGHTKSWQLQFSSPFGGGLQRASIWDIIPSTGKDLSPYTQVKMSILTPSTASLYASDHYSRSSGNDIGVSTAATQTSSCWNGITPNVWTDITIPFSSLGRLSSYNFYKGNLPGSNAALTCQVDDIIFLSGVVGWVFRGRTTGLETSWTDASTATPNYSFLPQSLGANCYSINNAPNPAAQFNGSVTAGVLTVNSVISSAIALNDTLFYDAGVKGQLTGGGGSSWTITGSPGNRASVNMASSPAPAIIPALSLTPSAINQLWKVTHPGFNVSQYTNFTFGVIPSTAGSTYQAQIYDPFGAAVGNLVNMSSTFTQFNFGTGTSWTVYNVPLSAFGAIGSVIGGISIKQNLNNLWYLSAIGFWA